MEIERFEFMKVTGPGSVQGPASTKKSGKAKKAEGDFGSMVTSETPEPAATKTTQSIAHVDALLAVQESEDPTQRAAKKRMRDRADEILDELDNIRMAMLNNQLTVGHMIDIADVVASHREKIPDPRLTSIMDEIDLRAQVELAKMRVVLDKKEAATG